MPDTMSDVAVRRTDSLGGQVTPRIAGSDLVLEQAPHLARFILRGDEAGKLAGEVVGAALPQRPGSASGAAGRHALWLGPDEWLLLAAEADGPAFDEALQKTLVNVAHALVDVSHRQTAILIAGDNAARALNAAVPLDLHPSQFPVGKAVRTIFEKAEIVLWRTGTDSFHIEVWRSFAPYVAEFLSLVRSEHAAEGAAHTSGPR